MAGSQSTGGQTISSLSDWIPGHDRGRLVPLAFVSPRIVSALLDGTAPGNLTVTTLAPQGGGPVRRADHEGVDADAGYIAVT
jgi:hypothetical protein